MATSRTPIQKRAKRAEQGREEWKSEATPIFRCMISKDHSLPSSNPTETPADVVAIHPLESKPQKITLLPGDLQVKDTIQKPI